MKLTWHIVQKDLQRLKLPLALWLGLMIVRLACYAAASGLWGPVSMEWLTRLQESPALLLPRMLLDSVIAYFLSAWLVFADPLVQRDAFWITRPISGGRLLGAKLLSAFLMFGVLPVLASIPWWLASGLGLQDTALAAMWTVLPLLTWAAVGMVIAALTDGFPRLLLWTFAALAATLLARLAASWLIGAGTQPEADGSGMLRQVGFSFVGGLLLAGVVLVHQYLTRRWHRSIVTAVLGVILLGVAGSLWSRTIGEFITSWSADKHADDDEIQLRMAGVPTYSVGPASVMWIPMTVDGLSEKHALVADMRAQWHMGGEPVWNARARASSGFGDKDGLMHWLVNPAGLDEPAIRLEFGLRVSPILAQRMEDEPTSFHATATVFLHQGTIAVRMAPQAQTVRTSRGSFTISEVRQENGVLSLTFTRRQLAFDRRVHSSFTMTGLALVGKTDGQVLTPVPQSVGKAISLLDSVMVSCSAVEFKSPTDARWFEDAELVYIEFNGGRMIRRKIATDAFHFTRVTAAPARQLGVN